MALERTNLLELRGDLFLAARNAAGNPTVFRFVGEAPTCNLSQAEEVELVKDTGVGGLNATLARIGKGLTYKLKLALRDIKRKNLEFISRGTEFTIASGSVTNESLADGSTSIAVGDYLRLANPNVTSLVVTDSTGTPVTLTLGTHYEITDAKVGIIKILSLASLTQPLKAAYTKAETKGVAAGNATEQEWFLLLRGENVTAKPYKRVTFEAYRLAPGVAAEIALKAEQAANFEIECDLLLDETRDDQTAYGPFYRIVNNDALDT